MLHFSINETEVFLSIVVCVSLLSPVLLYLCHNIDINTSIFTTQLLPFIIYLYALIIFIVRCSHFISYLSSFLLCNLQYLYSLIWWEKMARIPYRMLNCCLMLLYYIIFVMYHAILKFKVV